ncbi:alpha/beta hydrolase [Variovorax sp. dw_954]|uniref:alpha/beta fold hydrolase n=1 Tax=Variovorax sp. dw_954 TaxID=2720078 RepID=UPI002116C180|nr:alpha/beta hydrolase [Variovorax sp. dw_954]
MSPAPGIRADVDTRNFQKLDQTMKTNVATKADPVHAAWGQADADDPGAFNHCFAEVNGIRMHYVDEGQGPLVILLHGFPYLWYMWRRQILALAEAGYRVVAPDLRGYGQSDRPDAVEAHDVSQHVGDVVGLMAALGEASATVVGHDVGASVAQSAAMMRPDLFHSLVMLSTPLPPRGRIRPTIGLREMAKGRMHHHLYFLALGNPDRELASDTRKTLRSIYYSVSGSAVGADRWRVFFEPGESILDAFTDPKEFPSWLSARAIDYYVDEYTRTGFTGTLNFYRCRDRNWEITSFLDGAVIRQPSMFIGGGADPSLEPVEFRGRYDQLDAYLPGLQKKVLLPGVGHGAAEERPDQVNELLLGFLAQHPGCQ